VYFSKKEEYGKITNDTHHVAENFISMLLEGITALQNGKSFTIPTVF